ncbi:50S ribosomal protein L23 [Blattabacterium cuenoti]|uniref:50S ribosomal protein L23 n=1 Tax=Blattabacterium cuenoti TaxID=1653831 RepID=UPI00163BFA0E|nr:50S ribosomal protein L23 [Blattabacterium cuenoti]
MFIIRPIVTKRGSEKGKKKVYTFYIYNTSYNKIQIKEEINKFFGCTVIAIRTMIYFRKIKSRSSKKGFLYGKTNKLKKIMVQIKENQKIDLNLLDLKKEKDKINPLLNVNKKTETNNT